MFSCRICRMSAADIFGVTIGIIGMILSIVAVFQSGDANQMAEDANGLADTGNRLAAKANDIAKGANQFAFNANQIAEDANRVARRTFDAGRDQTSYSWRIERNEEGRLSILNDSIRDATDVSVAVRLEDETIACGRFDHLAAFEKAALEGELAGEEYTKRSIGVGSVQHLYRQAARSIDVVVFVGYTTELGVVRDDRFDQAVGQ